MKHFLSLMILLFSLVGIAKPVNHEIKPIFERSINAAIDNATDCLQINTTTERNYREKQDGKRFYLHEVFDSRYLKSCTKSGYRKSKCSCAKFKSKTDYSEIEVCNIKAKQSRQRDTGTMRMSRVKGGIGITKGNHNSLPTNYGSERNHDNRIQKVYSVSGKNTGLDRWNNAAINYWIDSYSHT